jgi:hypothetical protein
MQSQLHEQRCRRVADEGKNSSRDSRAAFIDRPGVMAKPPYQSENGCFARFEL